MLPAIPGPKLEPVSPRLKATLVHGDRNSHLYGVRYSPDGRRMIAGGYPDGIVQVWNAETGRQLTRFDAGYGYRGTAEYFLVSPDWKTLFAPTIGERKRTPFEREGERLLRWEFDSEVRAWDMETGDLLAAYRHDPPRDIRTMVLSPDGSTFLTGEALPGESEGAPKGGVSLWDVKNQRHRPLPINRGVRGAFSPDARTIALPAQNDDGYVTAIRLFDAASVTEKLSIPMMHESVLLAHVSSFTPDGTMLLGQLGIRRAHDELRTWDGYLKLWDATTGEELASLTTNEKNTTFHGPVFSPDGNLFAVVSPQAERAILHLFDTASRRTVASIVLTTKPVDGETLFLRRPAFSADGRWVAAVTEWLPDQPGRREPEPEELLQPRIHLVDVTEKAVAETLVAPQGMIASLCFSPDGKTLAAGGHGKVLLWDLEVPPGTVRER